MNKEQMPLVIEHPNNPETASCIQDDNMECDDRSCCIGGAKIQRDSDLDKANTEINLAVESERKRISDGMRKWLVSRISDSELYQILGISSYDWNILMQEKQASWNSYIGSLVDDCDSPDCNVRKSLYGEKSSMGLHDIDVKIKRVTRGLADRLQEIYNIGDDSDVVIGVGNFIAELREEAE
jgi:hypothetical protein